mmetsp:Transcript_2157/g.2928  ORF Transcript_2157/g.2928 Transcript_2157/m.2928 type:complete len:745 (+) Transcript_2157:146-2380(+)
MAIETNNETAATDGQSQPDPINVIGVTPSSVNGNDLSAPDVVVDATATSVIDVCTSISNTEDTEKYLNGNEPSSEIKKEDMSTIDHGGNETCANSEITPSPIPNGSTLISKEPENYSIEIQHATDTTQTAIPQSDNHLQEQPQQQEQQQQMNQTGQVFPGYYNISDDPNHPRPYSALVSGETQIYVATTATTAGDIHNKRYNDETIQIMNKRQKPNDPVLDSYSPSSQSKQQDHGHEQQLSQHQEQYQVAQQYSTQWQQDQSTQGTSQYLIARSSQPKYPTTAEAVEVATAAQSSDTLNTTSSADYSHFAPPHAFPVTPRAYIPVTATNTNIVTVQEGGNATISGRTNTTSYSRKDKALGLLAQRMVNLYENSNDSSGYDYGLSNMSTASPASLGANVDIGSNNGTGPESAGKTDNSRQNNIPLLSIDQTAEHLFVERRRIYDIINILEALNVVTKKGKNVYWWHGLKVLENTFKKLQVDAICSEEFHADAGENGMIPRKGDEKNTNTEESETTESNISLSAEKAATSGSSKANNKATKSSKASAPTKFSFGSLGQLTKKFLSLYLIGYDALSLGEATERLLGFVEMAKQDDAGYGVTSTTHRKRETQVKGWKTKVRRLYDIANVLCSIGIIDKTSSPLSHNKCGNMLTSDGRAVHFHKNNQYFYWKFPKTPKQLLKGQEELIHTPVYHNDLMTDETNGDNNEHQPIVTHVRVYPEESENDQIQSEHQLSTDNQEMTDEGIVQV